VLNSVLILGRNGGSDNFVILRKLRSGFFEFDLQILFSDHGSDDVLFVVNIPWSLDGFHSVFLLHNGLSLNGVVVEDFVLSIDESDLQIFLFNDGLDDGLVDVLVCRKRDFSFVDEIVDLGGSENGLETFLHFSSLDDIQLLGDFFDSGLDDGLVVGLVSVDGDCSGFLLEGGLDREGFLSLDHSVGFLFEFGNELLDFLVDRGTDHYSLSQGLHLFVLDHSRLADYSLRDHFGLGHESLRDYLGLRDHLVGFNVRFGN